MNRPEIGIASDYAILKARNAEFCYGYEIVDPKTDDWCFQAKFDETKIVIPFSKLGTIDRFNVVENLLQGIGWILAKYKLTL